MSEALHSLSDSAESSRAQLREMRAVVYAAVDSRFDEAAQEIDAAVAAKLTALERELVSVDAALEHWRGENRSFRDDVAALSDEELEAQRAALSSRLDAMEAKLLLLPTVVVEPPLVSLTASTSGVLAAIAGCVRVIVPLSITAADVALTVSPDTTHVRPGTTVQFRLSLSARHASQSDDEVAASLGRLSRDFVVEASLEASDGTLQSLASTLAFDSALRSVLITVAVPESASSGDHATIRVVSMMGLPVGGLSVRRQVLQGIRAPLHLCAASLSPCISPDGTIFIPPTSCDELYVFDADGGPLLGLSHLVAGMRPTWAAYACGDTPSLILAECRDGPCRIAALDPSTRAIRWSLASGDILHCGGITVLPTRGIAVIGSVENNSLFVHRLSDGARMGSHTVLQPDDLSSFLAADTVTGTVFGVCDSGHFSVHAWSCDAECGCAQLSSEGRVAVAGEEDYSRPLAVVPPSRCKTTSHLVVGTVDSSVLRVLSLPDLVLLHTHVLEGIDVFGLAADPWGNALAVTDLSSGETHVLSWPLPGMPLLT